MRVLVLGGTRFVGRAVTDAALGRGDDVTLFNRGRTNPGLYPGLETITGDRAGDLSVLARRDWDVVVDVAAYDPAVVANSVAALAGRAGRYVFVSTASVYADHSGRQTEGDPVLALHDGTPGDDLYGARKAASEEIVTAAFGDRALIARAGLIVGPHDPADRFGYWLRRIARGGRVLAPGDPHDPVQFVDVRDLAGWLAHGWHTGVGGVFNVAGKQLPFGDLLNACLAATDSGATLAWMPSAQLHAAGVEPWMGVPLWIGDPSWAGANDLDIAAALAAGLTFRPTAETIRDTLAWDLARGGPAEWGLSQAEEKRLLNELAD